MTEQLLLHSRAGSIRAGLRITIEAGRDHTTHSLLPRDYGVLSH